ncbi:MAG: hypothetical protein ABL930_09440 [Pseudobdellovibrio sp.]
MLKKIIILCFIFTKANAQNIRLDLNDVTLLLPLPIASEINLLPVANTEAALGALLPKSIVVEKIPTLLQLTPNETLYPLLHAVGFRVDPCFKEGSDASVKCKTQIRVVWQPLTTKGDKVSSIDVTLHTFYELSESQFQSLVTELKQLKLHATVSTDNIPLLVNPVLRKEGLNGPYYKKLLAIFYKYIGEINLSRITFMQLFGGETVWFFGGIDIKNAEVTRITIPRIHNTIQQFANTLTTSFRGGIAPAPKQADNLNIFLGDSSQLTLANEEDIIKAAKAAFKFENPKLHNPGTVDCVSCHLAQPVRVFAMKEFPQLNLDLLGTDFIYTGENLLNNSSLQNNTNVARIFGYFEDQPITTQRVINESAEVVKYIEANY